MALFDIAHMGKDFVRSRSMRKSEEDDESTTSSLNVPELDNEDIDFVETDGEEEGSTTDASMESVTGEEGAGESGTSERKGRLKSIPKRIVHSLHSISVRSMSPAPRNKPSKPTKEELMEKATYAPISMEMSNELSFRAYKAGYGQAYTILKSMNRTDREEIMKCLFISRKGETYNDELDSFDILFKRIYGIRGRTSTTLRSLRLMRKPTWIHTIFKAATALEISTKMVFSSGDWRLPTRLTNRMSSKQALKATKEDFYEEGSSALLIRAEKKFYKKLRGNMEARLGPKVSMEIKRLVIEKAGTEYAHLFEEIAKTVKLSNVEEQQENEEAEQSKQQQDEESLQEIAELEQSFHIPQLIANIEKVKPGFGEFAVLILMVFAIRAKVAEGDGEFTYTDKKDLLKKMAIVGAKDGIIGLSLGIPLATFVNPFLGFPLMAMSFINLSMGSTEFQMIEPVCIIMLHQLVLASNGTCVHQLVDDSKQFVPADIQDELIVPA